HQATTVGSESTGKWAPGHQGTGLRHWIVTDWTAGIGSPGIKSFGSTASTASSGKAVGSESTGMTAGTGADIESSRPDSNWHRGHQASGHLDSTQHAGTASSRLQGSGLQSQQAPRQWAITGRASGHQV
ncbi:unnamed protein product, partial [Staurois parvus]